jgi:SpoIIAA-like
MIHTELIADGVLKITVPEKLSAEDFRQVAPQIDSLVQQRGTIRLLVDASHFGGWEDMAAFEKHIGFVKTHHQKVQRIAVIVGHGWQYWVIGTVRLFVHPEIRTFDQSQESEARKWLTG